MLKSYENKAQSRIKDGINPPSLTAEEVLSFTTNLATGKAQGQEAKTMVDLLTNFTPGGVDEAGKIKAEFLSKIAKQELSLELISVEESIKLLGTMLGGYNIPTLIDLLESKDSKIATLAMNQLKNTILMFDFFNDVKEKLDNNNIYAKELMESWANAEWFTNKQEDKLAEKITLTVFKVPGETNTDDLSPAPDAWSRPDIPLHAEAMLQNPRDGLTGNPKAIIQDLKTKGNPLVYVGDVVGTGSSRKSAVNSVVWYIGKDINCIPNKRYGGFVFANQIAPIFFNTLEDSGALPIENMDVTPLNMGDVIDLYPDKGEIKNHSTDEILSTFKLKTDVLFDEVQAGGRVPLIIGRQLTDKARTALKLNKSDIFKTNPTVTKSDKGYTLAQKIVGKACHKEGVRAGEYCEPIITTVGSQDTTGAMTRDEIKDLACLKYNADLVMQSFCHTAPYPRKIDNELHATLPEFFESRGGIALRPGDGVIHSWINRMILPNTVGTGGDSHTRFPMGISFPAGSGLVAFAAATGIMPLDMPESILVKFSGEIQEGITLRDLVHSIPYYAIKQGLLTVEKTNKINAFSGKVLEIQGLKDLSIEQAFELSDASAERSASACTIELDENELIKYMKSNEILLKYMITQGYGHKETIERRIHKIQEWLKNPTILKADDNAEYSNIIEINLNDIKEPILCCPNDPDDVKLLSEVAGTQVDEVFIGSCMTNIGHFRASSKMLETTKDSTKSKLWVAPPTIMDNHQLKKEGVFNVFVSKGTRIETPGCSLCMGNQAQVEVNAVTVSTSTRNFPNRLGKGSQVFLASAEVATATAILGKLPTVQEYMKMTQPLRENPKEIYSYLHFNHMKEYTTPTTQTVKNIL